MDLYREPTVPPRGTSYRPRSSALPLFLAGAALVLTAWLAYDRFAPVELHTEAEPREVTPRGELADFEQTSIRIFQENAPSVVHIRAPGLVLRDWRYGWTQIPEGTGTGFIWDERGYIVTNFHVVGNRDLVKVRLQGLRERDARVVGFEPAVDIAVVKLLDPPPGLRPVEIGTSHDLLVGQAVFAIGNPFGLDHSLTTGVVSALDRVIESVTKTPIEGVIQVDAAINPGNSGGPLLDSEGRLIGMNTAIYSPSGASAGIGFAVPVHTINRAVPRLISGDRGSRPALGIYPDREPVSFRGKRHPMVARVVPDSGAETAGIRGSDEHRYGDVITAIDGLEVNRVTDIHAILDQREVGDTVKVRVLRVDARGEVQELELPVELKTETRR